MLVGGSVFVQGSFLGPVFGLGTSADPFLAADLCRKLDEAQGCLEISSGLVEIIPVLVTDTVPSEMEAGVGLKLHQCGFDRGDIIEISFDGFDLLSQWTKSPEIGVGRQRIAVGTWAARSRRTSALLMNPVAPVTKARIASDQVQDRRETSSAACKMMKLFADFSHVGIGEHDEFVDRVGFSVIGETTGIWVAALRSPWKLKFWSHRYSISRLLIPAIARVMTPRPPAPYLQSGRLRRAGFGGSS